MLAALEKNIAMVLALEDETSMESLDAKLEELQQELLKQANAGQDYDDLADEIDSLREKKQEVMADNAGQGRTETANCGNAAVPCWADGAD